MTPRSDKHTVIPEEYSDGKVVVFGVQSTIKQIDDAFSEFFKNPTPFIDEFTRCTSAFQGDLKFDNQRWEELAELGYLPIQVKSIPEGTSVPFKTPVFTINNTHPKFFWLVNYLETWLSCETWKPMTVATIAKTYRRIMTEHAEETGVPLEVIDFQCHDFSSRGLSGMADVEVVGSAHLTSFRGTDSLVTIPWIEKYYTCDDLIGASVPATEHSVMCMGTSVDEFNTFKRLITETYKTGIVSIVSDTWDFWRVLTEYIPKLKNDILSRQPTADGMPAKVVIRPDSGNPIDIICGTAIPVSKLPEVKTNDVYLIEGRYMQFVNNLWVQLVTPKPSVMGAVQCLYQTFGGVTNERGFKTLDSAIGLIYGDSITLNRANDILHKLRKMGFSSANIVFGVGSYSYQMITRDTFGFAIKATHGVVNGVGRDIFKNPKTDSGLKKSAKGLIFVNEDLSITDGVSVDQFESDENALVTIFNNGSFRNTSTFSEIRSRIVDL